MVHLFIDSCDKCLLKYISHVDGAVQDGAREFMLTYICSTPLLLDHVFYLLCIWQGHILIYVNIRLLDKTHIGM